MHRMGDIGTGFETDSNSSAKRTPSQILTQKPDDKDLFIVTPEHVKNLKTKNVISTQQLLKPPQDKRKSLDLFKKNVNPLTATTAATKIQSLIRGRQTRIKTVFPSEIKGFLDSNLTALKTTSQLKINTDALSKSIAREILGLSNSGALSEHGIKLQAGKTYAFEGGPITLPVEMWVKKTKHGVELEVIGQKLGSGTYKTVHLSRTFQIDLSKETHEKQLENTVAVKAKNSKAEQEILGGMKIIQDNFSSELEAGTIRLAGVVSHQTRKTDTGTMEARDVQYDGEFGKVRLTQDQTLQVLTDAAKTYQQFHAKGLVHRDVKPANIFVKNGQGYAADFDLTQAQGPSKTKADYVYWDPLSKNGIVTPFADAHGLARTACQALFGAIWKDSEDQIRSLNQFKEPPAELIPIRDAIIAVFEANKKSLDYFNNLLKVNKGSILTALAVQQLQTMFPAYDNFLRLMASYDKATITAPKVS